MLPQPSEAQAMEFVNRIKTISESEKRLVTDEEFKKIYSKVVQG